MNMQDNEIDNLFRSKLEGLEIEPSARVWNNITDELGAEPKRLVLLPYLSAAASIIVLIGAGLLFWPKVKTTGTPNRVAVNHPIIKPVIELKKDEPTTQVDSGYKLQPVVNAQPKQLIATSHTKAINNNTAAAGTQPANNIEKTAPTHPDQQQSYASVDNLQKLEPKAVVPDVKFSTTAINDAAVVGVKQQIVLASVGNADAETKQPVAKKRKLHGLGSLINAAVSLIDSRDDKLIEFTDTDEGDTVTGINLGIVKVKKVQ